MDFPSSAAAPSPNGCPCHVNRPCHPTPPTLWSWEQASYTSMLMNCGRGLEKEQWWGRAKEADSVLWGWSGDRMSWGERREPGEGGGKWGREEGSWKKGKSEKRQRERKRLRREKAGKELLVEERERVKGNAIEERNKQKGVDKLIIKNGRHLGLIVNNNYT